MSSFKEFGAAFNRIPSIHLYVLGAWVFLNLIQAACTELFHDEAYYWTYSHELAFGYAEHAPMIAVLIKLGTWLAPGELGVRLFPVLMNGITLLLLFKMVEPKNPAFFFALIFSVAGVHIAGFFAAPDAAMLCFAALFFYRYQFYADDDSWINTAWMLLAIVGILYSKYQGIMVLFFTLLSHLALLKRRSFCALAILACLLYLPHLMWLKAHDFASFTWHLLSRERGGYQFLFTWDFLLNQLLLTGPLMGVLILPAAFLKQTSSHLQRAWKVTAIGVFCFLFVMTFRTYIEANWSAAAILPLLGLSYYWLTEKPIRQKWAWRFMIPSLVVMLALRMYLVVDYFPPLRQIRKEFHGWPEWAAQIDSIADGKPVVFSNSFQLPAKYSFYTGKVAHSLNIATYHRTQYDMGETEEQVRGKSVCFISTWPMPVDTLITEYGDSYYYRTLDNFQAFSRIKIETNTPVLRYPAGKRVEVPLQLLNGYSEAVSCVEGLNFPLGIGYHLYGTELPLMVMHLEAPLGIDSLVDSAAITIEMQMPEKPGSYHILFSVVSGPLMLGINGNWVALEVTAEK